MINEIYQLYKSLELNNIKLKEQSDEVRRTTSCSGFLFGFDGEIRQVLHLSGDDFTKLKIVVKNNQNRFPVIKLSKPLLVVEDEKEFIAEYNVACKEDKILRFFKCCFSKYRIEFSNKNVSSLVNLLRTLPLKIKKELGDQIKDTEFYKFLLMLENWSTAKNINEKCACINASMAASVYQNFIAGNIDNHKDVMKLLLTANNTNRKVHIGFFPYNKKDAFFKSISIDVNKAFYNHITSKTVAKCALTGENTYIVDKTFPEAQLKIIGGTKLFTMFNKVPSQYRYGKSGSTLMPVSEKLALKMTKALEYICSKSFENKTWCKIPKRGIGKDKKGRPVIVEYDLLISYINEKIDIPDKFKFIIPQICVDQSDSIIQYEAHTKAVINAFTKLEIPNNINQKIIVITKATKGSTAIALTIDTDLKKVFLGISKWVTSVNNCIDFYIPLKREDAIKMVKPFIPSITNVLILSKKKYTRSGMTKTNRDITLSDIFNILLDNSNKKVDLAVLKNIYGCVIELFTRFRSEQLISQCLFRNGNTKESNKILSSYSQKDKLNILIGISFIQIMLDRLVKSTEERRMYMMRNLGNLLAKVDEVYIEYSTIEGKRNKPKNPLGNRLLRIAERNPVEALSRLAEEFSLYYKWGKVNKADNKYVGMLLAQIGKLTNSIEVESLPTKPDIKDKANLILGYLEFNKKANGKGEN